MVSDLSKIVPSDSSNWWVDRMYMKAAFIAAKHSPDPSTQVGSVLVLPNKGVLLAGWNTPIERLISVGYPRNLEDKNYCTEHSERGVLYKALQNNLATDGLYMYSTWAACAECARAIIQFGIRKVVTSSALLQRTPERWRQSVWHGINMMTDAGVHVVGWRGELICPNTIIFNGEIVHGEDLK